MCGDRADGDVSDRPVVVVGASAGGLTTAAALRRLGYAGRLVVVGAEPHPPYDRPPLSKQFLSGAWDPPRLALRSPAETRTLGLDMRLGTAATGVNPAERLVHLNDGTRLPYGSLVVATGVRARRPSVPGADGTDGIHVLRTLDDALALRPRLRAGRRLVIVGAGFAGTETAATARALGVEVTLVERSALPFARVLGDTVGGFLTRTHREHGVDVRTGVSVSGVQSRPGGRVGAVLLSDGSIVRADDVLLAVGSVPNTEWLDGSGLDVADGLVCDRFCVAAPGVYAVGDVARWHHPRSGASMRVEHRTNAAEQALTVAHNLLHPDRPRPFAPVPYFWTDQYGVRLQAYGHPRGHDQHVLVEGDLAQGRFLVAYRTGDRLSAVLAAGLPPRTLRPWREALATGTPWTATAAATASARSGAPHTAVPATHMEDA